MRYLLTVLVASFSLVLSSLSFANISLEHDPMDVTSVRPKNKNVAASVATPINNDESISNAVPSFFDVSVFTVVLPSGVKFRYWGGQMATFLAIENVKEKLERAFRTGKCLAYGLGDPSGAVEQRGRFKCIMEFGQYGFFVAWASEVTDIGQGVIYEIRQLTGNWLMKAKNVNEDCVDYGVDDCSVIPMIWEGTDWVARGDFI